MANRTLIVIAIGAAVAIGALAAYSMIDYATNNNSSSSNNTQSGNGTDSGTSGDDDGWNRVGFFGVNKHTYKLGENVFFAGRISPDDQVVIRIATPEKIVMQERLFSGADRELVKFYFKPDTSRFDGIYEVEQLVGEWMIWFDGVHNDEIRFTVTDEYIKGAEEDVKDIPRPPAEEGGEDDDTGAAAPTDGEG